ncbi:XRE family transcriptional regulator [Curtobacterium sp. SGAir0471]|nr:XRE family transcriptional regulator [Curtobacterium sp. SGAir0471]
MPQEYAPVTPAPLPHAQIRDWAERVGEHYKIYGSSGHADLDTLIKSLGGSIDYRDGEESLRVRARRDFTIYLPHMTSARRDRFTQSHELGHYFLHYLLPAREGDMGFGRGARNGAETQANVFASSLLMPESHFRRVHEQTNGEIWRLAQHFDVSPDAARVRCEVLGLGS